MIFKNRPCVVHPREMKLLRGMVLCYFGLNTTLLAVHAVCYNTYLFMCSKKKQAQQEQQYKARGVKNSSLCIFHYAFTLFCI